MAREEVGRRGLSRRNLLKMALLGGAVTLGGGLLIRHLTSKGDEWAFLTSPMDAESHFNELGDGINLEYYVPIGSEMYLRQDNPELVTIVQTLTHSIMQTNRRLGWSDHDVSLLVKQQIYGRIDENRKFSEQYEKYIKTAIGFLYERLSNLERLALDIRPLNIGDDYSTNEKGKALIGSSIHCKQTVIVTHKKTKENFEVFNYNVKDGSEVSLNFDSATGEFFYWIFFGRGKVAISAPFSEIIPLATYKPFKNHWDKKGMERAIIASETISESISYLLSHEISNKLGITDGKKIIEKNLETVTSPSHDRRYAYVSKAIEWMKKNGMQRGLDLYIADPEKFMSEVCS